MALASFASIVANLVFVFKLVNRAISRSLLLLLDHILVAAGIDCVLCYSHYRVRLESNYPVVISILMLIAIFYNIW